ncbi:MAG: hypothetical protein K6D94_02760 [Clostridiales bacterium]|nr:hypothetical protein [Clostridiales bacterium]
MPYFSFGSRTFEYGFSPLPEKITVGDSDILAAPASLCLTGSDGKKLVWVDEKPFQVRVEDHTETWSFSGYSEEASMIFNASIRAEEDGYIWCDLVFVPRWYQKPSFSSLCLEIPLKSSIACLVNACSLQTALPQEACGELPSEGIKLPFVPSIWLGCEESGLCLTMETDAEILSADKQSVIEVVPDGDAAVLRVHLFDSVPKGWESDSPPAVFGFGLHATPVKVFKDIPGIGRTLHVNIESLYNPKFENTAKQGIKYIIFHENWSIVQNYGFPRSDDEIKEQVRRCHDMGMKTLAYFGYEYASNNTDFAENWSRYLIRSPEGRLRGGYERHSPSQRDFIVCYNSRYADTLIERVHVAMDVYGFDGIYTDGTLMVFPCANEAHGCGKRDRNGELHYTFPIRAWRDMWKRLAETVHSRGGIIDSHNGGYCFSALYPFTDTILDGEALQEKFFSDMSTFSDVGLLRSQFGGKNFGLPTYFIIYHNELIDPLIACGIEPRFCSFEGVEHISSIWKEMDAFGTDNAEFLPPWDKSGRLSVSDSGLIRSGWIKKGGDNGALVVIYNPGKEDKTVSAAVSGRSKEVSVPAGELRLVVI